MLYLAAARLLEPLRQEVDAPGRTRTLLRAPWGRVLLGHTALPAALTAATAALTALGCALAGALPAAGGALAVLAVAAAPVGALCAALSARRGGRLPVGVLGVAGSDPSGAGGVVVLGLARSSGRAWPRSRRAAPWRSWATAGPASSRPPRRSSWPRPAGLGTALAASRAPVSAPGGAQPSRLRRRRACWSTHSPAAPMAAATRWPARPAAEGSAGRTASSGRSPSAIAAARTSRSRASSRSAQPSSSARRTSSPRVAARRPA